MLPDATRPIVLCNATGGVDRLCVVVPFRDRDVHLQKFLHWMRLVLRLRDYCFGGFYVIEQADRDVRPCAKRAPMRAQPLMRSHRAQLFERGWLLNIGYTVGKADGCTYFALHDVDELPDLRVSYAKPRMPTQLSSEIDRFNYGVPYSTYAGAVLLITAAHMEAINGFSNAYRGWGVEDDDLYHRLRANALLDGRKPFRPPRGQVLLCSGRRLVRHTDRRPWRAL